MTLQLPDVVETYFEICNGGDVSAFVRCFSADATVLDERKTHVGLPAIVAWMTEAQRAFVCQVQPLEALRENNTLTVTALLTGNFPGSPVELSHRFILEGAHIRHLEITPC